MQRAEYTSANRKAWNEAAPVHDDNRLTQVLTVTRQSGYHYLSAAAAEILKQVGFEGKAVAHLCCNNGRELLSIRNSGAGHCVGFDIADNFVEQARQLARSSGIDCEFVRTDVYEIPHRYDGQFDIVYISVGTLGWMPDIKEFFRVAVRLLRKDGWVVVYEMHPILDMFDSVETSDPPVLHYSYFRAKPFVEDNGLDYRGQTPYKTSPSYWFHHKLSDILDACLAAGLSIRSFQEYDHDITNVYTRYGQMQVRLPLSFSLITRNDGSQPNGAEDLTRDAG